jgi:hypothetical protein
MFLFTNNCNFDSSISECYQEEHITNMCWFKLGDLRGIYHWSKRKILIGSLSMWNKTHLVHNWE